MRVKQGVVLLGQLIAWWQATLVKWKSSPYLISWGTDENS